MQRVIVAGGGVGGLAAALALGRAGHPVTVVEQDPLPATADAEEAFTAERRGAPQVHQTHGFLARLQVVLRDRFPDVFDDLLAVGCTTMTGAADLGEPQPGDEDLKVLVVRRTTLEWVLRQATLRRPEVAFRTGVRVTGVAADGATVTGVRLDDGTTLDADLVVASTGRRGAVPAWLSDIGVDVPERVHESGLMYLTRWYRLPGAVDITTDPKLGGNLGFVKYLAVPGDAGTLSVTLAVRTDDADLRAALSDGDRFDEACRILPGPDRFFRDGPLEPLGGVRPMAGLINRVRRFVDDAGEPTVLGFHAVGDAHTCTNPLYGRGCSLAFVQAVLLADTLADHPDDPAARARAYEAACRREIEPWFDMAVQMDEAGADPGSAGGNGADEQAGRTMAAVFVAAATEPVLARAMARLWNLLATPADLMADGAFLAKVAEVVAEPDKYPPPPREGPSRRALLEALTVIGAARA
ncbi:MAG TPA: FAD-dependent monooxygenase [Acidimicrobiales bacterium]|nr:FAD-dependent monooxygenase [Acidimicrobiales bacterium]